MHQSEETKNMEEPEQLPQISHTPGPWRVANNSRSVLAGSVKINQQAGPAAQSASVEARNEFTLRANANLIASAPDLLAALRKIRAELCRRHSPFVVEMDYGYINEAINKATGTPFNKLKRSEKTT